MLASQESMLRSQPSEADYRAATVKQRPTSRRITPAEISVRAPIHSTLADSIYWHTNSLCHLEKKQLGYTTPNSSQVCMQCFVLCILYTAVRIFLSFKTVFNNTVHMCFAMLQSLFERQGMTLHGGLHPGIERGHIPLPKGMSRTKSFGKIITHPVHIQIR